MPSIHQSPFRLLIIMALSIFLSEFVVMIAIYLLPPFPSRLAEAIFDAAVLIVMLSPILYFFLFKPMLSQVKEREYAEEEVVKLNRELEWRISELEELNVELESFSYSVSHDLRSPLFVIQGFSQLLAENYVEALDSKGADFLKRIVSSSKRMSQIIDSLLTLSHVAREEIQHEELDLSEMASTVAVELSKRNPTNHVEVIIEKGVKARGDARLLRIVMENLLDNAWKYTSKQPKPRIEFGMLKEKDESIIYYVRDNGVGFDTAYADKLFMPFERLHSGDEYPGTGVGLATVKRIVHRHGGRVWAESGVGNGAVFYFGPFNGR
ncbi:MAG: bacteriophytochrome (light-regulated signal transduction histidine kinase) [Deltaproteobacteria bacterium]|nr:bacteriophytochrome (light-regulated signal transduction histidine kinase) [Deltaproteobacteria bacterium]